MTHTPQMGENHAIISQDLLGIFGVTSLKITSFRVTILSVYAFVPILLLYIKWPFLKHFSPLNARLIVVIDKKIGPLKMKQ